MAEPKTRETDASVDDFLDAVEPEQRREDARAVRAMMEELTGEPARMWGPSIVGFGRYKYVYASGRSGEWMLVGFSPRKAKLVLYIMSGFEGEDELMGRLGRFKTGKSCLYLSKLADVDIEVLRQLVERSVRHMRQTYG